MVSKTEGLDGQLVTGAWSDMFKALRAIPRVLLLGFVTLSVMEILLVGVETLLTPHASTAGDASTGDTLSAGISAVLFAVGTSLIEAVCLSPPAIAIHRFILLGERTGHYRLALRDPQFQRFVTLGFLLNLVASLPGLTDSPWIEVIGSIVTTIILVRLCLAFPAIAVDGAGWREAVVLSRGHGWRIFWLIVLSGLLGAMVYLVFLPLGLIGFYLQTSESMLAILGVGIVLVQRIAGSLLLTYGFVATLSRIYRVLSVPTEPETPIETISLPDANHADLPRMKDMPEAL